MAVRGMLARRQSTSPPPAGAKPDAGPGASIRLRNASGVPQVQREDVPAVTTTPKELISKYTTLLMLDEAGLGKDLAARVVERRDVMLTHGVFDNLRTTDRDDVAEELARSAGSRLREVDEGLRIRLIREMLDTVVDEDAEKQVTAVWLSFENEGKLGTVITNQRALWDRSLSECTPLSDRFAAYTAAFGMDILKAAGVYLDENRKITEKEAKGFGLNLGGAAETAPPEQADAYLDEVRKAARVVVQLQALTYELRLVPVGYRSTPELQQKLSADARTDAEAYKAVTAPPPDTLRRYGQPELFDPARRPDYPPTGKEEPEMAQWTEAESHHSKIGALIAEYARNYPAVYASITQGNIGELAEATDAGKARGLVENILRKTLTAIEETRSRLGTGITHYDLAPIQQQLFTNTLATPAKASVNWQDPLYAALGRMDLEKQKAKDFWTDLGLNMVSAFALIAAPFTGGMTAAVLVGAGLAVGAGMAAASWDRYLQLRPLENAAIRDDLSFVQKGAVDAALLEATVATVGVFLDALGVHGDMKRAAGVNRVKALADLHGAVEAQEAAAQARMKMQAEGLKDAGAATAGAAAAIGAHELEDAIPEPDIEVRAGGLEVDLPSVAAPAQRSVISTRSVQRAPNKQLAAVTAKMAAIDTARDVPRDWGNRFELSVVASVLRGEVPEMSGVVHAFQAQHNASGHGIDIIAVGTGSRGRLKFWQIECKWAGPESGYPRHLGGSRAGIQTSAGWTKDNFVRWWEAAPPGEKRQLLNAVKAANGGRAIEVEKLTDLISRAEVIIAAPLGAGAAGVMRRIWGEMGALTRFGGRKMSYREFRPR
ncbi:hypothetical protein Franean1_3791 [Parafrankia sp. EAN1pec]|nr:hypothetical protein Franean1_3791 [Frankia sp. EAN1pec]